MSYTVYILYSHKTDKFYVRMTNNPKRRLREHNNKETPSTVGGVPWVLLWSHQKPTFTGAMSLERKLKNLSRARKIRFMHKYSGDVRDLDILESLI